MNGIIRPTEKLAEIIARESPELIYAVNSGRNYPGAERFCENFLNGLRASGLPFISEMESSVGRTGLFLPKSRILPVYVVANIDVPTLAVEMPERFSELISRRFEDGENLLRPTFVTSSKAGSNMEMYVPQVLEFIAKHGLPHRICVED